jgi:hypothetical protein
MVGARGSLFVFRSFRWDAGDAFDVKITDYH